MQFSFIARDASGREITDTIEAASKLEAADKIFNERKLTVIRLEKVVEQKSNASGASKTKLDTQNPEMRLHIGKTEKSTNAAEAAAVEIKNERKSIFKNINDWLIDHSKVTAKEKAIFFRQLAVMINAGLPIVKSLKIFVNQTENLKLKKILESTTDSVESGNSFANTLAKYDDIFTDAEIGVIASGETSGQLNRTLLELATETEKSASLRGKIKSAMIYPASVLSILVIVVIVVMVFVIPKMTELFVGTGVALPMSTRILIAVSDWFTSSTLLLPNYLLLPLLIFGAVVATKVWHKTASGKYYLDRIFLRVPIFGMLQTKAVLATFARQLSTLSSAGVSIIRTLEISSSAVGNEAYRLRILEVKGEVEHGIPIHQAIADDKLFPNFVVSMIAVGEQTAQLANVTEKIAEFYDEEVDTFVQNLSKIIEPFIIVFVGLLVGIIVAAIMQPIMSIANLASQV